ncbi:MAG: 23S rRNA (adenine(2503)-C(2))-methyltransferase RlmN [Bacteroidales bacterium]|nr:23S rRNA (adenine(2503)-C(2))-methyltransferase RlmN [Bacteroidales bacterium]
MKKELLGMTLSELQKVAVECGQKPFVGAQIAQWLYNKRVASWDGMRNVSSAAKLAIGEKYELGTGAPIGIAESSDGTRKYLFAPGVEAVMIPDDDRKTLCVSSQVGCKMSCKFCMTGRQGWHGNLSAAGILNQFLSIGESRELTNAVFMGMGEPLDNYGEVSRALEVLTADWGFGWSPKRVTVSTIGVLPELRRYLDGQKCHLAVSLHNPIGKERAELMPVEKAWPIEEVVNLVKRYDFTGQRRVSFEYTMFAGWNDDKAHADALSRLLRGLECRVNLIRFHKIPDFPYETSAPAVMEAFRDRLNANGITCTIRASRGEDILAACGMLAGKCRGNNE